MSVTLIVVLVILGLIIIYLVNIFNQLVALRNRCKNGFAQIDVQLKRRYDLIPNLVDTAKAYLKHEKSTLTEVIAARNGALSSLDTARSDPLNKQAMLDLGQAEAMLSNAMSKLNVVVEAYPDLKANANMMQVSEELVSTENRVAFARQSYNDQVMEYNTYKESFPQNIVAGPFGHADNAVMLDLGDKEVLNEAPKVNF